MFSRWYERLLSWALRLTHYHRANAEDLVHDVFVELALRRSDNQAIENVEGYLFTMLRNMHKSQIRRARYDQTLPLCITDYDSLELGLHTITRHVEHQAQHSQLRTQEELSQTCRYAWLRKENSKAWSVLILRFFHGYYPAEIEQITRASRAAVDEWLWTARQEARLHINDPQRLRAIQSHKAVAEKGGGDLQLSTSLSTVETIKALQEAIFATRRGECFSREKLERTYRSEDLPIECKALAHVVSCPACLDEVNRILGLLPLARRHPTDMLARGKADDDDNLPGSCGGGVVDTASRKVRRRVQEIKEHQPKELHITVNGSLICEQKITSDRSDQILNIDLIDQAESLEFIEVFGEQGLRLLMLEVSGEQEEHTRRADLCDGRYLVVSLNNSSQRPKLRVVYCDEFYRCRDNKRAFSLRTDRALRATTLVSGPRARVQSHQ